MPARPVPEIDSIRRFHRFYTKQIGVLEERLVHSPFSLTQARVLYELANRTRPTAKDLARDLGIDAGYLSRILSDFQTRGLVRRRASAGDGREHPLSMTGEGREAFARLDARSSEQIEAMLRPIGARARRRLVAAMGDIEEVLRARAESRASASGDRSKRRPRRAVGKAVLSKESSYRLRRPRPGDMGWVVHRHGVLYAREYGWDERFEALVAEIVGKFVQNYDAQRERCWIAEKDGEVVGSVFLVKGPAGVAKLRLLLVEPSARGLGIGARLVAECIRFAKKAGYEKLALWTQRNLSAARAIYARAGFRLVHAEPHESFGHELVAETWELDLARRIDRGSRSADSRLRRPKNRQLERG